MLNNFEFSHIKEIIERWLVYEVIFMNNPIKFLDRDNKAK